MYMYMYLYYIHFPAIKLICKFWQSNRFREDFVGFDVNLM